MFGLFEMSDFNLPRVELHKPYGVFSAALVVISHFSDSLYSQISNGMTELYGANWKKKLKDDEILPKEFIFRTDSVPDYPRGSPDRSKYGTE
jgi:hypothetical protein